MRKLALSFCFAIVGCCSVFNPNAQQAEEFRTQLIAKVEQTPGNDAAVDPSELLRHIPVGTPVFDALMILDDNGFNCEFPSEGIDFNAGTGVLVFDSPVHFATTTESLEAAAALCLRSLVPDSWARGLVSTNIHGEIRCAEGRVTGATIRTSMTGP